MDLDHHHHNDYVEVVSAKGPAKLSPKMKYVFIAMTLIGFGAFAAQVVLNPEHNRIGWISFLHNLYFFTGLSAGGVVLAAILQAARANWGRPFKRFAEASGQFLPFSVLGVIVLYFGAEHLYEWVKYPPNPELYHNKAWWLQKDFVFGRQILSLAVLALLAKRFVGLSVRPDLGLASEKNSAWKQPSGWNGSAAEIESCQAAQSKWAVFYCFGFAFLISFMAYDLIMSLEFRWISTMFGGWNFTTFILLSWGSMFFIATMMSKRFGLEKYMHAKMFHDLGKLTFGFTVVWGYLFFAQLIVIWYSNFGHETWFFLNRFKNPTWMPYSLAVVTCIFAIPFILGLSKQIKMSPMTFMPVVAISFIGVWLERFFLIAPGTWYFNRHEGSYEPGITGLLLFDVVVFVGFLGLFCLCYTRHLYKHPVMVISDPRLDQGINRH